MTQKPELHLLNTKDKTDDEKFEYAMAMYTHMTGKPVTPEGRAKARASWDEKMKKKREAHGKVD